MSIKYIFDFIFNTHTSSEEESETESEEESESERESETESEREESEFLLTVTKSPEDSRDWIGESIFPAELSLPKILDYRKELQPIRNQGAQGSCAAQSSSCMKEWQERRDIELNTYMSPQFIYNNRENEGEGMYGRDVMRILSKLGCCLEKDYEYGKVEDQEEIDDQLYEKALNFRIKAYAQIKTIDGCKKALFQNGPCLITFPVYNHSTTMWKPEKINQKMSGGHAMTIVGYNKEGFIIRNSWGQGWGDNGYCIYPFDDFGMHWEIWTTIDDKSNEIPEITTKNKCCIFLRK